MRGVTRRAEINGVGLAYATSGPAAPTVVLLHALGETKEDWELVADRLVERYAVVAVDLRGHGESDWPGAYSTQRMADDVAGLLDHLGLHAVTVLGHSLGGVVGYRLAIQRPDLVARLIVEDVTPPYARDRPMPDRPDEELPFDWPAAVALRGEAERDAPALWQGLASIQAPTLLVYGGPDSPVPPERIRAVAEHLPDGELVEIGGGHYVHRARPEEFIAVVLDWLDRRS